MDSTEVTKIQATPFQTWRNWILQEELSAKNNIQIDMDSGSKDYRISEDSSFRFSSIQKINSLNNRILANKQGKRQSLRKASIVSRVSVDDADQQSNHSDSLKVGDIKGRRVHKQNGNYPSISNSYRRQGHRLIDDAFDFINSELVNNSARTWHRRNSDSQIDALLRYDQIAEDISLRPFLSEPDRLDESDAETGSVWSQADASGEEVQVLDKLPHPFSLITTDSYADFSYNSAASHHSAHYEGIVSDDEQSIDTRKVSFDDKIVYLENKRRRNMVNGFVISQQEADNTLDIEKKVCSVCKEWFSRLRDERMKGSDQCTRCAHGVLNPLFIDDDGFAHSNLPVIYEETALADFATNDNHLNNGISSINGHSLFHSNGNASVMSDVNGSSVIKCDVSRRSLAWSRSRKLCMAISLMIIVLTLAGIGIGMTIYFD